MSSRRTAEASQIFVVLRMIFLTTVFGLVLLIASGFCLVLNLFNFLLTDCHLFLLISCSVMFNNTMGWISPHHSTNFLDKLSLSLGLQEPVYTVVIDAGSTGSRVLAFTFHRSLSGYYSIFFSHIF